MNREQYEQIRAGRGFIAALDQSGGSTAAALAAYGVGEDGYSDEAEMFERMHEMRTRIVTSPVFRRERVIGAILFEDTMSRDIEGQNAVDYLWQTKGVVPFLKVDQGLAPSEHGARPMKPMPDLDSLLDRARERGVLGTKMRSVVEQADADGIAGVVEQQLQFGRRILSAGLVPILEPEVDIHAPDKAEAESMLRDEIQGQLAALHGREEVMLKLSLPERADFYHPLVEHPRVLRVVALSGGYSREDANRLLARNPGVIASFSRALTSDLHVDQSGTEFDAALGQAIDSIHTASVA